MFLRTALFLGRTKACLTAYGIQMMRLDGNCGSLLSFDSMNQRTLGETAYISETQSLLLDILCKI